MSGVVQLAAGETWKRATAVKQGETFDFVLRWRLGETPLTYADLSLYTIRCSIRLKGALETETPALTLTEGSGITVADYVVEAVTYDASQMTLRFLPAQTATLIPGRWYKGDIRLTLDAAPTQEVRFPLSLFEFLVKGAQTSGS